MLNVERRDHVDARAQKREHVEEAFGGEGAGLVGMREFVDQHYAGLRARIASRSISVR